MMSVIFCAAQEAVNNITLTYNNKVRKLSEAAFKAEGPVVKTGKFKTKVYLPGETVKFPNSEKSLSYSLALARKTFSFVPLNEELMYVLPAKGKDVPAFLFKKKWYLKIFSKEEILMKSEKTPIGIITNAE